MIQERIVIGIILLAVFCVASVRAENKEAADKIAATTKLLGDDDYKVRAKASSDLILMLEDSEEGAELLKKFENHQDPEVRLRVKEALRRLNTFFKWIDPVNEKNMKSISSTNAVRLLFKNISDQTIKFCWIDYFGKRQAAHGATLKPGQSYRCGTFETHVWLVTDTDDKALGLYVIGKEDAKFLFKGAAKKK